MCRSTNTSVATNLSAVDLCQRFVSIFIKNLVLKELKVGYTLFQSKEWVCVQGLLSIIRAVSLRLRGTRRKIRSFPFEDEAALSYV